MKGILYSQRTRDILLDDEHEYSGFTRLGDTVKSYVSIVTFTPDVTLQSVEVKFALTVGKKSLINNFCMLVKIICKIKFERLRFQMCFLFNVEEAVAAATCVLVQCLWEWQEHHQQLLNSKECVR